MRREKEGAGIAANMAGAVALLVFELEKGGE